MKKFSIFLLILVILGALCYYFFPLEMVVKKVVNKYGSEVTGTDVNLQGFKINLQKGEVSVSQITVANPANYKTKYAVQLGNISVAVDLKSVTTDTIIIKEILVHKPVVSYEMMSLTQNNIADIINNINAYTSSPTQPAEPETDKASKKVIIKKVIISNGEINGAMTAAPDVVSASIPLPTVTLSNIGESSAGTSVADSIALILNKLFSSVSTTVISSNLANLKDAAQSTVNTAKDVASGTVDAAKDTAGSVLGGVKDTFNSLNPFGK